MIHKIHNACYNIIKVFTNYYSNDKKQGGNEGKGCNDQKRGGVLQALLREGLPIGTGGKKNERQEQF